MKARNLFGARPGLSWENIDESGIAQSPKGNSESLRTLAVDIESALAKDSRGVSLTKALAIMVKGALFDLADRIDAD